MFDAVTRLDSVFLPGGVASMLIRLPIHRMLVIGTVLLSLACRGTETPSGLTGFDVDVDPVVRVPTSLEISPEFLLLDGSGDTATVSAKVRDQDGVVLSSAVVTWSTANSGIAAVMASGLVTAKALGVSVVEARSESLVDSIPVIVATTGAEAADYLMSDTLVGVVMAAAGTTPFALELDTIPFVLADGDEFQVYVASHFSRVELVLETPDGAATLADLTNHFGNLPSVSRRIIVSPPGTYQLIMDNPFPQFSRPTPYSIWSFRVNYAPEFIGSSFQIGDTVRGEALERPIADVDEFQVTIDREVFQVLARHLDDTPGIPRLSVGLGPVGNPLQRWSPTNGTTEWQALGTVDLRFYSDWELGAYAFMVTVVENDEAGPRSAGGYEFLLQPINQAPELVPSTFSLGDTVQGETIEDPVGGDIDEFSVTLTEGDSVSVYFNALTFDPENDLQILLLNPSEQTVLGFPSNGSDNGVTRGPIRVASSETHYVWVYGQDGISDSGPYEFALILSP